MENELVVVKNLKKNYHDLKTEIEAVKDVSFSVKENEFVSIVGPSGCGKSTILSILAGLEKKSDGDINLNNDLKVGYMLQSDSLFSWRTILENCLIGLEIENNLTKESVDYVVNLLKVYGLEEFMNKYPDSLSGGMRQRVALIRTLATKPDILLLDEPLSKLDYQSRLAIGNDIYKIIKKEKKTAIMVTHDIAEAVSMSDRVIVLSRRPCVIKHIYEIELNKNEDPLHNRYSKEFNTYYEKIWRDLDVQL